MKHRLLVSMALFFAACGGGDSDGDSDAGGTVDAAAGQSECSDGVDNDGDGATDYPDDPGCTAADDVVELDPLEVSATWSWFDIPGATCGNGDGTGLGIRAADGSNELVIFLAGGGVCSDNQTCFVAPQANYIATGYQEAEFLAELGVGGGGPHDLQLFARDDNANPFRGANYVFVPYCTGDLHSGDKVTTYDDGTVHHVGFANMERYLETLHATFTDTTRIYLMGISAGGGGAVFNWSQVQETFASARVDVINDSGPWFPSPYMTDTIETRWRTSWAMDANLPSGCADCLDDLGALHTHLAASQTGDARAALLAQTRDSTLSAVYGIPDTDVEAGLGAMANAISSNNYQHFYVTGTSHLTLGEWDTLSEDGTTVRQFLTKMVGDDADWASVEP